MIITRRLTQEKPIIFDSSEERIVNINTITLESADDKYSIDIFCENKRKKEVLKICSLKKDYQEIYSTNLMLDLHNFKDKYEFFLKTKCKKVLVNIIGCYEQEEDDESEQLPEQKVVKDKKENKGKKELKEKKEIKKEKSDSESDSSDEKELDDNRPSVSLVELLNKKRKEEPQEIKPLILNNLVKNKEIKKDKKEKKEKIKVESMDNKINKKDIKNKKEIKAK